MNILVSAATAWEMKIIKNKIKNLNIHNLSVKFFTTGIGNYNTTFALTNYLLNTNPKPDLILNIWVCGYIGEKQDLLQIARIINASTMKESIVPIYKKVAKLANCLSSENIVEKDLLGKSDYVVDMESFAVDFVWQKFQIPRIILKVPVDKVWEETRNFDFAKALDLLEKSIDWKKIMEKIVII